MMNQKGQFFLIFAVIIGIAILVAATQFNLTSKDDTNKGLFDLRCQNYKNEIFKISQYAIENIKKEQEFNLMTQFSQSFYEYMNRSYDSFDMVFLYGNSSEAKIIKDIGGIEGNQELYDEGIIDINGVQKTYSFNSDYSFYVYMKAKKGGEVYVCE